MSRGAEQESAKEPDDVASASASKTGDAEAGTGATANSGTMVGNTITNTTIGQQNNHHSYSLFSRREKVAGWGICLILVLITAGALLLQPEGPREQFTFPYVLLVLAHLVSIFLLFDAWAWSGEGRRAGLRLSRSGPLPTQARLMGAFLCLTLAVFALLRMDHLRDHGELDIINNIEIDPDERLTNQHRSLIAVDLADSRRYLRLGLSAESSQSYTSCASGTVFELRFTGQQGVPLTQRIENGRSADLDLGERIGTIEVELTVDTADGCEVDIHATEAILHN